VQEAASRSTTGISMFILARGHESPAARLASLAEERSVHPLAWRQVLTTGKADRTRVSRAIGVGSPSGTGVTGTDDAPGRVQHASQVSNNPLRYRTTRGHNASGRT
jgi:hypothetical protein